MAATKEKTAAKRNRKPGASKPIGSAHGTAEPKSLDAVALLEGDHREVEGKRRAAAAAVGC